MGLPSLSNDGEGTAAHGDDRKSPGVQVDVPHEIGQREGFRISTDPALLEVPLIHDFLANRSYWAPGIPFELVRKSIENSLCFGLYDGRRQIGFARVVTDRATFAWLGDVFILEEYRGRALGKWLIESIIAHPHLQGLRRFLLGTRDAHGLYRHFGFTPLASPDRFMEIHRPDIYADAGCSK